MAKIKTILVDIDGTIVDISHRVHFIKTYPKDHQSFYDNIYKDIGIAPIIDLVRNLFHTGEYKIVFVTGRPDSHRQMTIEQLDSFDIPWNDLYMRAAGDHRSDVIVKREILREIQKNGDDIEFVLDDRKSVTQMWRQEGLICLQVAPGDFDEPKYASGNLILLVGPSGAGKSLFVNKRFPSDMVVSSDVIRTKLCGDFLDQSKNDQVFHALHQIVKSRLENGLDTVVDATNLRNADRKAILKVAPEDCKIEYVVINRSMERKIKDGGWRNGIVAKGQTLIERHEHIFQSNLKAILAGDNDPRVTVIDRRE